MPGVGWDFEDGTFQGWKAEPLPPNDAFPNAFDQHDKRKKTHVGLNAPPGKDAPSDSRDIFDEPPGPVFGNNVDVFRTAPPGFVPAHNTATSIGGDYWRFARGVNYSGNWWIGSGDIRRLAIFAPGKRIDELANGALLSPSCTLSSDYVSFRIGGTRATSRVCSCRTRAAFRSRVTIKASPDPRSHRDVGRREALRRIVAVVAWEERALRVGVDQAEVHEARSRDVGGDRALARATPRHLAFGDVSLVDEAEVLLRIAPSTDANGFTSPLTSRYGSAGMSRACRTTFRPE